MTTHTNGQLAEAFEDAGGTWPPAKAAGLKPPWFRLTAPDDDLTVLEDSAQGQLFIWRRRLYSGDNRRHEHVTIERADRVVDGEVDLGRARIVVDARADEPHVAVWLVHAIEDAAAILWPREPAG